eukprot:TRINITY_DN4212_c0_g1_i1.p1 TRINITY_DN4212_c0_g1~~TRINITY_DN4212_c0_g1_i1.p1  ORF type:complete len:151 (-),score=39.17 TRINITY_DN4212_c0_g1_i1:275-727(-)
MRVYPHIKSCGPLEFASEELRADRTVVLESVKMFPFSLKLVAPHLRQDRDIVLAAVSKNGAVLQYAGVHEAAEAGAVVEEANTNATPAASRRTGKAKIAGGKKKAKRKLPVDLTDELEVVEAAVLRSGEAVLQYASQRLQSLLKHRPISK